MCADGQEQKLMRQIDRHRGLPFWDEATEVTRQNFTIPQPKILSPDAPFRHYELCFCQRLFWPQVERQLIVEPQQIRIKPHMTNSVICHYRFYAVGKVAGHPRPPSGFVTEQGSVDGNCKVLRCHEVCDSAQAVLPTLTDSRGVFASDIRRNARGRQIYAHPVNNPTTIFAWLQLLTTVNNSHKYFRRRRAPPTCKSAA